MSEKLRQLFFLLESAMLVEWQKANKKDRDKLCKKLGELEGKLIIEEINKSFIKENE